MYNFIEGNKKSIKKKTTLYIRKIAKYDYGYQYYSHLRHILVAVLALYYFFEKLLLCFIALSVPFSILQSKQSYMFPILV